jgi:hypothetical protein
MSKPTRMAGALWAIVVADEHGFDSGLAAPRNGPAAPVQYCQLNRRRTPFQDTLQRALRVTPASQVIVTALDTHRVYWEPALWFIRPEHRFLSTETGMSWLTTAAAILAIADKAPDSIVTLLPGRCFVSHESILTEAIDRAISLLPIVPEAVISLGMQDLDGGIDEDYLIPLKGERQFLQPLLGIARRPLPWIAQHLRSEGALVASRVTCSYARTLGAHISLVWPGLTSKLMEGILAGTRQCAEGGVRMHLPNSFPKAMLRSRHWYPPALPQRALRVRACGWSGLRTARAVARISNFLAPTLQELPRPSSWHPQPSLRPAVPPGKAKAKDASAAGIGREPQSSAMPFDD